MRNALAFAFIALTSLAGTACAGATINDRWPAFAPDGKLIAFERSHGRAMDIYVVSVDGQTLRRVTRGAPGVLSMSPAWFPDGRHLLYATTDLTSMYPSGSFFEISARGGTPTNLAPAGARGRSISRDGKRVLFLTRRWEVAVLDLRSGAATVVSHPRAGTWDTEAAWSPDDTRIAFGCNFVPSAAVGRSDICVMNADGSDRHVLSFQSGAAEWVTWSPDGTRVAFQSDEHDYTAGAILVADVRTGHSHSISSATGYALNETPDWSADGRWIAFAVKTPSGYRIALIHPDGSGFHLVT